MISSILQRMLNDTVYREEVRAHKETVPLAWQAIADGVLGAYMDAQACNQPLLWGPLRPAPWRLLLQCLRILYTIIIKEDEEEGRPPDHPLGGDFSDQGIQRICTRLAVELGHRETLLRGGHYREALWTPTQWDMILALAAILWEVVSHHHPPPRYTGLLIPCLAHLVRGAHIHRVRTTSTWLDHLPPVMELPSPPPLPEKKKKSAATPTLESPYFSVFRLPDDQRTPTESDMGGGGGTNHLSLNPSPEYLVTVAGITKEMTRRHASVVAEAPTLPLDVAALCRLSLLLSPGQLRDPICLGWVTAVTQTTILLCRVPQLRGSILKEIRCLVPVFWERCAASGGQMSRGRHTRFSTSMTDGGGGGREGEGEGDPRPSEGDSAPLPLSSGGSRRRRDGGGLLQQQLASPPTSGDGSGHHKRSATAIPTSFEIRFLLPLELRVLWKSISSPSSSHKHKQKERLKH